MAILGAIGVVICGVLVGLEQLSPFWGVCGMVLCVVLGTLLSKKRYLNGFDALMLKQSNYLHSYVNSILFFKGRMSEGELFGIVRDGLLIHRRMREKIVARGWMNMYWEEVEINIKDHVQVIHGDYTEKELMDIVSKEQCAPMDMEKPVWVMKYFPDLSGDRSALYFRYLHSYADGISMTRLLLSMTPQPNPLALPGSKKKETRKDERNFLSKTASSIGTFFASLRESLLLRYDPKSIFKPYTTQSLTSPRLVRWVVSPFSVSELKEVSRAIGGVTINDILFSCLGGAHSRYAAEKQNPLTDDVTAVLWVSLQGLNIDPKSSKLTIGNSIGVVSVKLPSNEDCVERTKQTSKALARMKGTFQPFVTHWMMRFFGSLPTSLCVWIYNACSQKITVSMSNVPGPQAPVYFGPLETEGAVFVVPTAGDVHEMACLLSFNGRVYFAVSVDSEAITDPDRLCALFNLEMEKLRCYLSEK